MRWGISWCVRIPQWPQKGVVCIPEGMKFRGWLESSSSIWTQFLQASGRHFENNTGERNSNQGYKNFELRVMEVIRKLRQERLENKLKGRQLKQQRLSCIFWRIETTLIYYISSAKRIFLIHLGHGFFVNQQSVLGSAFWDIGLWRYYSASLTWSASVWESSVATKVGVLCVEYDFYSTIPAGSQDQLKWRPKGNGKIGVKSYYEDLSSSNDARFPWNSILVH